MIETLTDDEAMETMKNVDSFIGNPRLKGDLTVSKVKSLQNHISKCIAIVQANEDLTVRQEEIYLRDLYKFQHTCKDAINYLQIN